VIGAPEPSKLDYYGETMIENNVHGNGIILFAETANVDAKIREVHEPLIVGEGWIVP
jgi:hypothetical protein